MRVALIIVGVVLAFLIGAFVEHEFDMPFGLFTTRYASIHLAPPPEKLGNTYVPSYSTAQGVQDAPRADTPQGARTDFQRCVNTMILRNEKESEARTVCQKIIAGIGG